MFSESVKVAPSPSPSASITLHWSRDGVRAWLVCLATLYANAVTWGVTGSTTMLLPRLVEIFKYSNASDPSTEDPLVHTKTSTIFSVMYGLAYLMTLPAAIFVQRLGCRLTLLFGTTLFSAGSVLTALWPHSSIWIWWIAFGATSGTGTAFIYLTTSVVLEQVFDRRFGAASSLSCLGSTFTFMILPYIWNALMALGASATSDEDNVQGTATGLSYVMFSISLSLLLCIPMLPLFGSPFFIAVRQQQVTPTNADISRNPLSNSSEFVKSSMNTQYSHCYKQLFFKLFDIPVSGYKYSSSKTLTCEHVTDDSSDDWKSQLRLVWEIIKEWNFFIFIVTYTVFLLFSCVPDTYIVSCAEELFPDNIETVNTLMLNSYGIGQALGKISAALLLNWTPSLFGCTQVVAFGMIIKGIATGLIPTVTIQALRRLEIVLLLNGAQGLCDGLNFGGYSALIQSLVGSERYALALSISIIVSTPSVFAGSPLAGLTRDLLKDYSLMFAVSGVLMTLMSLPMLLFRFERDLLSQLVTLTSTSSSARVSPAPYGLADAQGEHKETAFRDSRPLPATCAFSAPMKRDTAEVVATSAASTSGTEEVMPTRPATGEANEDARV